MQRIEITKSFKYAFRGHRVEEFSPGVQEVADEVAELALAEKWGKKVSYAKMNVDEISELLLADNPELDEIPAGLKKDDLIEWHKTGIKPLFKSGEVSLEDMGIPELLEKAKEKYPDIATPEVVEKEDLIAFIGSGDITVFDHDGDSLQDKELPELLEIAKGKYPDVEVSPETAKDVLIAFIEDGDASKLTDGDGN